MKSNVNIAIIGAGQAGLAIAYYLQKQGQDFVLLEQASEIGHSWRKRYDSLTLFTPNHYNQLPGLSFPADSRQYPNKDEVADYLKQYAAHWGFPIKFNTSVESLTKVGEQFEINSSSGTMRAKQVIVATGPFQRPFIPKLAENLSENITQLHSSQYKNSSQLPKGTVLVVGSGNSGLQIADELLTAHSVALAQGKKQPELPQVILGQSLFWWFEKLGISRIPSSSWLGKRLKARDPIIGSKTKKLEKKGLKLYKRVTAAEQEKLLFEDGQQQQPQSIIWATGFRPDFSWIKLPLLNAQGYPKHQEGISEIEGLYFLGLSWQRRRGSALLGWVAEDAKWLADTIIKKQRQTTQKVTLPSLGKPTGVN